MIKNNWFANVKNIFFGSKKPVLPKMDHPTEPKVKLKLLGLIRPQKGQKVWELDPSIGKVTEAIINEYKGPKGEDRKGIVKHPDHWYCIAINLKNAEKKFKQMYNYQLRRLKESGEHNENTNKK